VDKVRKVYLPEDDLEFLDTFWRYSLDGKRIGDIFCEEMFGFKYKSAREIVSMLRESCLD
jgi:hypothetical protein